MWRHLLHDDIMFNTRDKSIASPLVLCCLVFVQEGSSIFRTLSRIFNPNMIVRKKAFRCVREGGQDCDEAGLMGVLWILG